MAVGIRSENHLPQAVKKRLYHFSLANYKPPYYTYGIATQFEEGDTMDTNTDHRSNIDHLLMTPEIPLGWATAYLDTSAHTCEVVSALIHQRTERMLQTPVEMARIYHAYWTDAARHYAEAADAMMDIGNKLLTQSQKSLHR